MSNRELKRIAIIGGSRIPFCRSNSLYAEQTNLKMLSTAISGLVDKYKLAGVAVGEVVGGAVVSHSRDWNLAREAIIDTKLHPTRRPASPCSRPAAPACRRRSILEPRLR